jgi:hypothetical protein
MRILVEMIDSLCVEGRGAPDDAVNLIPFVEQKFGKIRAVLTGDSSNERFSQMSSVVLLFESDVSRQHFVWHRCRAARETLSLDAPDYAWYCLPIALHRDTGILFRR